MEIKLMNYCKQTQSVSECSHYVAANTMTSREGEHALYKRPNHMGAVPIEILQLILTTQTQNQQVTTHLTFHFILDKNVRKENHKQPLKKRIQMDWESLLWQK